MVSRLVAHPRFLFSDKYIIYDLIKIKGINEFLGVLTDMAALHVN